MVDIQIIINREIFLTFTTLDACHSIDWSSKPTAVMSAELRLRIGTGPVTVTDPFATCHATLRPVRIGCVTSINYKNKPEQRETYILLNRAISISN